MGAYARDPVSELFDDGARRLLERAHANKNTWVSTTVQPPGPRALAWAAGQGISLLAADPRNARLHRWERGFVRAVYHLQKWHTWGGRVNLAKRRNVAGGSGAVRYEVGRRTARGLVIRIMAVPGGQAADKAVQRAPEARQYTAAGTRRAANRDRDWEDMP